MRRVSSQAIISASRRVSSARGLISPRLPMGVAIIYSMVNVPFFISVFICFAYNASFVDKPKC